MYNPSREIGIKSIPREFLETGTVRLFIIAKVKERLDLS